MKTTPLIRGTHTANGEGNQHQGHTAREGKTTTREGKTTTRGTATTVGSQQLRGEGKHNEFTKYTTLQIHHKGKHNNKCPNTK